MRKFLLVLAILLSTGIAFWAYQSISRTQFARARLFDRQQKICSQVSQYAGSIHEGLNQLAVHVEEYKNSRRDIASSDKEWNARFDALLQKFRLTQKDMSNENNYRFGVAGICLEEYINDLDSSRWHNFAQQVKMQQDLQALLQEMKDVRSRYGGGCN